MKRLLIALSLTIVALGFLADGAHAAGGPFKKWRAYGRPSPSPQATTKVSHDSLYRAFPHYSRYQSVEDAYPKYIGAFHARYFNDLGIPSGDVGIRGNTVQMLPW